MLTRPQRQLYLALAHKPENEQRVCILLVEGGRCVSMSQLEDVRQKPRLAANHVQQLHGRRRRRLQSLVVRKGAAATGRARATTRDTSVTARAAFHAAAKPSDQAASHAPCACENLQQLQRTSQPRLQLLLAVSSRHVAQRQREPLDEEARPQKGDGEPADADAPHLQ